MMNAELEFIGLYGCSSEDPKCRDILGDHLPEFVSKESNGTNEDRIRIPALGPGSDLI